MPVKKNKNKKLPVKKKKPVKKKLVKAGKKAVVIKKRVKSAVKKEKNILIGEITHYFPKVRAAVVLLKTALSLGDSIKIKGHTTDFAQAVDSMQIDRVVVKTAKKGKEIGLLVNSRVRKGDKVYKG
ncbi:MAG: hypothetical protein ABIH18_05785 [Candidatus Omnitrophota bacterium]